MGNYNTRHSRHTSPAWCGCTVVKTRQPNNNRAHHGAHMNLLIAGPMYSLCCQCLTPIAAVNKLLLPLTVYCVYCPHLDDCSCYTDMHGDATRTLFTDWLPSVCVCALCKLTCMFALQMLKTQG